MRKIIIGIHGLGNKPPAKILKTWWKQSIKEGLLKIDSSFAQFKFELVYWADLLHEQPLNLKERDKKSPLYLEDPYTPTGVDFIPEKPSEWKKELFNKIERKIDDLFFKEDSIINYEAISDLIIRNFFKDLDLYYHKDMGKIEDSASNIRKKVQQCLYKMLRKYKRYKILLVAHSMGTIISYDVLSISSEIKINVFVTMGSPLGLPVIIKKILKEQNIEITKDVQPNTPGNIKEKWYNFSDLDDKISFLYNLENDYKKNSSSVGPEDIIVDNDYEYKGHKNPHKSYGYLRTPEVAKVIHEFLQPEKETLIQKLRDKLLLLPTMLADKITTVKYKHE